MPKKLTKKQRDFIEEYVETGNGTKAALAAYDTDSEAIAASIAYENLRKPQIVSYLEEAFPDQELFVLHKEGLHSEDLGVRHRYLDTAYKLKGSYAAEKHVNLNVDVKEPSDRIKELAEKMRKAQGI